MAIPAVREPAPFLLLGLAGLSQLGDRRGGQPLSAARELPEGGHEISDESPCSYSGGSTSPILRAHGAKIDEQNRCRSLCCPLGFDRGLRASRGQGEQRYEHGRREARTGPAQRRAPYRHGLVSAPGR
jgi:hypothetical protein